MIAIKFIAEADLKALGKAEKGLTQFTKTARRLAGSLGIALGTTAITRYAKASVKAFADDDKAARILSKSLDNLGLHFADKRVKDFIGELETQFGVLDDYLRPAYQKLLTTTGDYLKSQDLLKTALDLAAFSQESVTSTAADLAKAYAGNTRGLLKYGIGLTKAELAASSFEDILEQIAKVSKGAALTAANSYSGSMDRLNVAAANASETIGKGLVQALSEASSAGNFEGAISDIDKLAKRTEDFIVYVGRELQLIAALPSLLDIATGDVKAFKDFLNTYKKISDLDSAMGPQQYGGIYATKYEKEAQAAALKKLAADKRAAAAKMAADKKAAADKKTLAKGNALFDLEQIGIAAALKLSIDKDTRLRLELLQAIQIGDADLVLAKMKELAEWQKNSDMAKLSRITTISEKQLAALNSTLLAELDAISKLNISEAEKDALRAAAFSRYNDAIKYAGGLAALETYSQKLQDQELLIQRLASISKVSAAQSAADAIRQAALDKYLSALTKPVSITATFTGVGSFTSDAAKTAKDEAAAAAAAAKTAADAAAAAAFAKLTASEAAAKLAADAAAAKIAALQAAAAAAAEKSADELAAERAAAAAAQEAWAEKLKKSLETLNNNGASSTAGFEIIDMFPDVDWSSLGFNSDGSAVTNNSNSAGDTVINFNGSVTTTSTEEFAQAVQTVLQNQARFGNNLTYAGSII